MSLGATKIKPEGGQGGKKGHSGMCHWDCTEEIKIRSKKARRLQAKKLIKETE